MRYVIRERFFRLGEDSDITDEQGQPVYHVDGKVLTLHNTLIVRDRAGAEVARVERQLIALRPTYRISRPGTEPVALAVGMTVALEIAVRNMAANQAKLEALRARLWQQLQEVATPVVLNGPEIGAPDVVPTTLNVAFPGCRADLLLMALDLAGVACSTGSACSSGSLLPSPVLRAMGVPDEVLRSALPFKKVPLVERSATCIVTLSEFASSLNETDFRSRAGMLLPMTAP